MFLYFKERFFFIVRNGFKPFRTIKSITYAQKKIKQNAQYDYSSPGWYFITTNIKNHRCVFGDVISNKMKLNKRGKIVQACRDDLPNHYPPVYLDEFIIMPNHIHGIIAIQPWPKCRHGLPEIVRAFKTFSSRRINETNPPERFQ